MTRGALDKLIFSFYDYANTFRDATHALPKALRLKLDHTDRVMMAARHVMKGQGWTKPLVTTGEACALLHDTARFLQFHAFGTFRDRDSFDHAESAVEIIQSKGWLAKLPEEERRHILTAVRLHNKREVPASLEGPEADLAHLVRDADKLDIFLILEEAVGDGSLTRNPELTWGLPMEGAPSAEIVEAVCEGRDVDYDAIRVFADFVLVQVGWLNGGLHFKTSARIAVERKALEFRENLLKTFTDDHSGITRCCDAARAWLEGMAK